MKTYTQFIGVGSLTEAIKGRNNKTGETFGMVVGSDRETRDGYELTIRVSYSSRMEAYKLTFDEDSNLIEIYYYGFRLDGKIPDLDGGDGSYLDSVRRPSKKETLSRIAKITNPSFAKKIHNHVLSNNLREEVVNERAMKGDLQKVLKQKGYAPIFTSIENSKRDLKRSGYSRGEIQDTLFDMFGDEDPKIVQKIKEEVVNEALVSKDKKAVDAFFDKKDFEGKNVNSDGKTLSTAGLGAQDMFTHTSQGVKMVGKVTGRYDQSLVQYVNKNYKSDLVESVVNEAKYLNKADAMTAFFKGEIDAKELDSIAKKQFNSSIATKKQLSDFLSNNFSQEVMSDTYGIPKRTLVKKTKELMKFAESVVNEARNQDPTYDEMVNHLENSLLRPDEFAIEVAIHFYAEANHGGMRSNLYSALSQASQNNNLRPRGSFSSQDDVIKMLVDELVDEFGGEKP